MATYKSKRRSGTQKLVLPCSTDELWHEKHVYCIRRLLELYISTFPEKVDSTFFWYSYTYNGNIDYSFSLSYGPLTLFRGQKESRSNQCKLECDVIKEITCHGADILSPFIFDDWYEAAGFSDVNRAAVLQSFLAYQSSFPISPLNGDIRVAVEDILSCQTEFINFYFSLLEAEPIFCFVVPGEIKFIGHEIKQI